MLELEINEEFLKNYRQYKLDLVEGKVEEDIEYTALNHILKKGYSISNLLERVKDNNKLFIDVKSGEIINDRFSNQQMIKRMKLLANL